MTQCIANNAYIDPRAIIGDDVQIGPFTYIGPEVVIGDGNRIENHVTIKGKTTIGDWKSHPPQCRNRRRTTRYLLPRHCHRSPDWQPQHHS